MLSRRQSGDIVIVCVDTNASIGRGCLGGLNANYGAVGPHGIDFLNDFGRRLCSFCGQLIDSDHSAVFCQLRFTVRLRRKLEPRAQLARLDTAQLLNQDQAVQFATDVVAIRRLGRIVLYTGQGDGKDRC